MSLQVLQEDHELLKRLSHHDERALDLLFAKYYQSLCQYASTYTHDRTQVEELVADVFVKVWQMRQRLSIRSSLKAYLYRAVRNQVYAQLKNKQVEKESLEDWHLETTATSQSPEKTVLSLELKEFLRQEINQLPLQCRKIFKLHRHHGLKYREIAEVLEISNKTVENQMGIAVKKLRDGIQRYESLGM